MLLFQRIYDRIIVEIHKRQILIRNIINSNDAKHTFTHITYYSVGNAGDTTLSECVRKTFAEEFNTISWKLSEVDKKVDNDLIRDINSTEALIIGGGGLFLPDTNPNNISGWQWACSKEMLSKINVPIIIYSVGYNYFKGQKISELFRENLIALIEKSSFVGLRNMGSVKAVRKLLPENLREKVIYQPCTTTLIRKIYPGLPPKKKRKNVAFNIAFDRSEMRYGSNKDVILSQISLSIDNLIKKVYKIYIIAHCTRDLNILPYLNNKTNIKVLNAASWFPKKLINFYNNMDVVIGMRGHAQMIPFGLNCHIISLGSHDKMRWFLEDIDAEDLYIDITNSPETLCDRIIEKFHVIHEVNGEMTTKRLLDAQEKLYKITHKNMQTIKSILEDSEK